jgi:ankyrin repeat protein
MNSATSTTSASSAEEKEDTFSLVIFLLGSVGYEEEADTLARLSTRILKNWQVVEGISRFQFPTTGKTRLMYAAKTGNLKRLNFIADLGARVNMTTKTIKTLREARHLQSTLTALHYASENGHTDCVRSLLDRGAMIDAQSYGGDTALRYACKYGHLDVARLLCERGAQMDLRNKNGRTALHMSSIYAPVGYIDSLSLLDRKLFTWLIITLKKM